ncbi:MAG: monovalent cation/H(+) antiporter subunit G [Chitinispirillaceae bacterium]|nr:monovalent cation/H(+) antiporter subunit G [Chitinispirillaceae bacterium]
MFNVIWNIAILMIALLGAIFTLLGVIGLYRFKDNYTRLQASSLATTTAPFTYFILALFLSNEWQSRLRILIIILFFFISSPITTHIIGRYIWKSEGEKEP